MRIKLLGMFTIFTDAPVNLLHSIAVSYLCPVSHYSLGTCGAISSRHLGVKITDFTDFHPILSVFQRYLRKLGYFTPKLPCYTSNYKQFYCEK